MLWPDGTWLAVKMPSLQYCTVRFQRSMNSCASLIETEPGSVVARSWVVSAALIWPPSVEFCGIGEEVRHPLLEYGRLVRIKPIRITAEEQVLGIRDGFEAVVHRLQKGEVAADAKASARARGRLEDARQVVLDLIERRDRGHHLVGLGGGVAVVAGLAVNEPEIAQRGRKERQWRIIAGRRAGAGGGLGRARHRRRRVDRRIARSRACSRGLLAQLVEHRVAIDRDSDACCQPKPAAAEPSDGALHGSARAQNTRNIDGRDGSDPDLNVIANVVSANANGECARAARRATGARAAGTCISSFQAILRPTRPPCRRGQLPRSPKPVHTVLVTTTSTQTTTGVNVPREPTSRTTDS